MIAAFCRKAVEYARWLAFKILLIFVLFIFCSPCGLGAGEFYRWVDENGVVHVSDNFPESSPSSGNNGKQEVQRVRVPVNPPARSPFRLPVNVREPEPYLSPDEYRIPFTVAPTGGILVKGILNDSVEVNMLFDTGATYAVISEETARQLASSSSSLKSRKITLLTGGGPVESRTTTIAKVTVGDVSKENVVAAVMPESGSLVGSDAILGLSFLKDFQATVDYKNRVVILKRH